MPSPGESCRRRRWRCSPHRRSIAGDWRCGGNVYAHIDYAEQQRLKGEILRDALARIGRIALPEARLVVGSPEAGYRMRARFHVDRGRVGFFREGTHELCDATATGQLLPDTSAWLGRLAASLQAGPAAAVKGLEIAENVPATERSCHLDLQQEIDAATLRHLAGDIALAGLSISRPPPGSDAARLRSGPRSHPARAGVSRVEQIAGLSTVADVLHVSDDSPPRSLRLRRDVRAFFQGNRFLLEKLVRHVLALVPEGPVVDLYAGVGLFGLAAAAARPEAQVTLVEGERFSAANLRENAEPFGARVDVRRMAVEAFLATAPAFAGATLILDPPRTGMSPEGVAGIARRRPPRIVFVSCDPATLARDVRTFSASGYQLAGLTGFDLFPNTGHVEAVALVQAESSD